MFAFRLLSAVLLGLSGGDQSLFAQTGSLAGAANKAAEQSKNNRQPTKVYTNSDLKQIDDTASTLASDLDSSISPVTPPIPLTEPAREAIVKAATPAVVTVETGAATGSGFFVTPEIVLTNRHVVEGGSSVRVKFSNGRTSSAHVTATAVDADLALLRVENPPATQSTLTLGDLRNVQVGGDVLAIGSAFGVLQSTVTRGIVSAVRTVGGLRFIQTDAAINPGNSGGPLIDSGGKVVGITTLKFASAESLGFAIAIDHAKTLLQGQTLVALRDSKPTSNQDSNVEKTLSPPVKSDTDLARERGIEQFEAAVRTLAQAADSIDLQWRRYRAACAGKHTYGTSYGRDWFGVWADPVVIDNESTPECRGLMSDIVTLAVRVSAGMQGAEENARRAGVYPGSRRDIRRKYSMDWVGWDR
jgi:S1-C subfamily serine protease